MSDSISNIRNVPSTRPVGRIRRPGKDEKPQDQESEPEKGRGGGDDEGGTDARTQEPADRDKPLLDEYV